MGVDTNQWRVSIGCFCPHLKIKVTPYFSSQTRARKGQCVDIRHFMLFFTLLVVCGCIEKNPGPQFKVRQTDDLRLTEMRGYSPKSIFVHAQKRFKNDKKYKNI